MIPCLKKFWMLLRMTYLLDTHTFLWFIIGSPRLSEKAKEVISNAENTIYLSAVSGWEIAIKARLGKLELPDAGMKIVLEQVQENDFSILPVSLQHTIQVFDLPPIHRDPFDRMLISQAIFENIEIITNNRMIENYQVETLW